MIPCDVHFRSDRLAQAQVLMRCQDTIREHGVDLRFHADEPPDPNSDDPAIIHHCYVSAALTRRVIVFEKNDSAELIEHDYIEQPNVLAVVKHSILRHGLMRTAPLRMYLSRIERCEQHRRRRLSDDALAKLRVGLHFGQYNRLRPFARREPDLDSRRAVDVTFTGSADYAKDAMNRHRRKCVAAISALPCAIKHLVYVGSAMPQAEYIDAAYNSRIIVSPWGAGQSCYRDYEAMFAGAVMVKPNTDEMRAGCGLFRPGVNYIPCRADFADLPHVVERVLADWTSMRAMRERNRAIAVNEWDRRFVAKWVTDLMGLWR